MKKKHYFFLLILGSMLFSCGKDDSPETSEKNGPNITSFSPKEGPVGQSIWITGQNFGATIAANTVKIGNSTANITSAKTTEIFITVPEGATTGKISVTVNGKTNTAGTFTVIEEEDPKAESIVLDKETLELFTNDSATLIATITGETNSNVVWSSDNEDVVAIGEEGKITAISMGTAEIMATIDNKSATCLITVNPNVYVVGREDNGNNDIAKLWINGTPNNLTNGSSNAQANSIAVNGSDVFVAGIEMKGNNEVAKVWRNGEILYNLTNETEDAFVPSIITNNTDVYVAGSQKIDGTNVAKVWKNDALLYNLTNGATEARAYSVFFNEDDIYVTGFERTENFIDIAKVWKNGSLQYNLTDGSSSAYANSVYVQGTDIYVGGNEENENNSVAKIWKNGSLLYNLTDGSTYSYVTSIVVNGNDIYAVGAETNILIVWKNGQLLHTLTDGSNSAVANSIQVNGTDIYVVGRERNENNIDVAKIWKNGVATNLSDGNTNAWAFSVLVK